jgi:hypothetical protein
MASGGHCTAFSSDLTVRWLLRTHYIPSAISQPQNNTGKFKVNALTLCCVQCNSGTSRNRITHRAFAFVECQISSMSGSKMTNTVRQQQQPPPSACVWLVELLLLLLVLVLPLVLLQLLPALCCGHDKHCQVCNSENPGSTASREC